MAKKRTAKKKTTKRSAAQQPEHPKLTEAIPDVNAATLTCVFSDNTQCQFVMMGEQANLSTAVKIQACLEGIARKLKGSRDPKSLVADLMQGNWPTRAAATGRPRVTRAVVAYARVLRSSDANWQQLTEEAAIQQVATIWKGMSAEDRAWVQDDWRVKAQMKAIALAEKGEERDITTVLAGHMPQPTPPECLRRSPELDSQTNLNCR